MIYQIDDFDVVDAEQAMRVIAAGEPSQTLVFHGLRAGAKVMVPITLGQGWQEKDTPSAEYFDGYLGMDLEMWDTKEGVESGVKTPVITKVHSLGPAHKAQIASSQRSIVARGPYVMPYVLDVKTVTGVVFDGMYHPVRSLLRLLKGRFVNALTYC